MTRAEIALDYLRMAVEDRNQALITHYTECARRYGADDEQIRHVTEGGDQNRMVQGRRRPARV